MNLNLLTIRTFQLFIFSTLVSHFYAEAGALGNNTGPGQGNPLLQQISTKCSAETLGITRMIIEDFIAAGKPSAEIKIRKDLKLLRQSNRNTFDLAEKKHQCIEKAVLLRVGPDTPFNKVASGQLARPIFSQLKNAIKSIEDKLNKQPSPEEKCGPQAKSSSQSAGRSNFDGSDFDEKNSCVQALIATVNDLEMTKDALSDIDNLFLGRFSPKATFKNAIDSLGAERKAQFDLEDQEMERIFESRAKRPENSVK